jgi:hypothetical protein
MNYFLVIFIDFFIFLNLNSNLNFAGVSTARYRYRTPAVTAVTAVYRAVPSGKKNPGLEAPPPRRRLLLSRASAVAPSLLPRQPAVARSLLPRADGSILQLWYRTGSTFVVDWACNGAEAGDKGLGARAPVVLSRDDGSLVAWPRGGCFCKNIGS